MNAQVVVRARFPCGLEQYVSAALEFAQWAFMGENERIMHARAKVYIYACVHAYMYI